jgi:hypothetical protein
MQLWDNLLLDISKSLKIQNEFSPELFIIFSNYKNILDDILYINHLIL